MQYSKYRIIPGTVRSSIQIILLDTQATEISAWLLWSVGCHLFGKKQPARVGGHKLGYPGKVFDRLISYSVSIGS